MKHRLLLSFIFLLFSPFVFAADSYTVLKNPQPVDDPAKIEVIEFFSLGCPHCAAFSSSLRKWESTLQKDVVLRRIPVTFGRAAWTNVAKLYWTLDSMGEYARLESKLFAAIHVNRVNLFVPNTMRDWLGKEGVDLEKFDATFKSFGINSAIKRADKIANDYAINGVPAMVINGKYLFEGTGSEILKEIDALIEKERQTKK